jgi:hypothetical protein
MCISRNFMHLHNKKGLILCSPHPYLRFSYSFHPRGESATFLFATAGLGRAFTMHLAMFRSPNQVLTPSQSTSKRRSWPFVPFSKIFVWESWICKYFACSQLLDLGWALMLPKRRFWKAEQTFRAVVSKPFSKFSRPKWSTHVCAKCFENTVRNTCSTNEDFGQLNKDLRMRFLQYFSRVWVLALDYHWLKTCSKTHTQRFVQPSTILRLRSTKFLFDRPK